MAHFDEGACWADVSELEDTYCTMRVVTRIKSVLSGVLYSALV